MSKKTEPKELFERAQDAFAKAQEELQKSFNKATKEFSQRLSELFGDTKELRDALESKAEQGTEAFFAALGLATKAELEATNKKLNALSKRIKELEGPKTTRRAD